MKNKIEEYKRKLEKELCEYMKLPVSERSASAVRGMVECWAKINEMGKCMTASEGFSAQDIQRWNDRMVNEDGTTVFLVEQNANQALHIANRGYVMENGVVVMEGKAQELLSSEKVRKAYLGM